MSGDLVHVRLTPGTRPGEPTRVERVARHEAINDALEGLGIEVVPPCPMAPYAESSEPAPRAYHPRLGPGDEAWQAGARG